MFWYSNTEQNSETKCGLKHIYSCKCTESTFSWKDLFRILFWKYRRIIPMKLIQNQSIILNCWDKSFWISLTARCSQLSGSRHANPRKCKTSRSQKSNRKTRMLETVAILKAWRAVIWELWRLKSRRAIWQMKMMKLKVKEPWAVLGRSKTKIQAPRCWALFNTCRQFKKQWQKPTPLSLKSRSMPHSRKPLMQEQRRKKRAICLQPSARLPREEQMIQQGYFPHLATINLLIKLRPPWVDKGCRFFKNQANQCELQKEHRILYRKFQGAPQALKKLSKHIFRVLPKFQNWTWAW